MVLCRINKTLSLIITKDSLLSRAVLNPSFVYALTSIINKREKKEYFGSPVDIPIYHKIRFLSETFHCIAINYHCAFCQITSFIHAKRITLICPSWYIEAFMNKRIIYERNAYKAINLTNLDAVTDLSIQPKIVIRSFFLSMLSTSIFSFFTNTTRGYQKVLSLRHFPHSDSTMLHT